MTWLDIIKIFAAAAMAFITGFLISDLWEEDGSDTEGGK